MQKIRVIFLLVALAFLAFSHYNNIEVDIYCPIEELVEDVEAKVSSLIDDIEDDVANLKNSRRNSGNEDSYYENEKSHQLLFSDFYKLEKNTIRKYELEFELWSHEEISYLHRFQLY